MKIELEKIANSLKGVASILSTMSEVPEGTFVWNEWAMELLYKELSRLRLVSKLFTLSWIFGKI